MNTQTPTPEAIQAISDWIVERGLASTPLEALVGEFAERMVALGIPVTRLNVSTRTLHPSVGSLGFIWRRGRDVAQEQFPIERLSSADWNASPMRHMLENHIPTVRRSLVGPNAKLDFPILHDLKAEGNTAYYARSLGFSILGSTPRDHGIITTWATDSPDGFTEVHMAVINRVLPRLALAVQSRLMQEIATNVADTYLGHEAGGRVLRGEIHKGSMDVIHAVLLYADLRDFTAAGDTLPRDELIEMLDQYFERIVAPITARGGEVLKYLGDGLLATFNLEDSPQDSICRYALSAAYEVLQEIEALNQERRAAGHMALELDVALHLGDVLFGNVGAADRLDFTVIGPAVNEASRLELLCKELGRNLLVSETFAAAATECAPHLVSLGKHHLRGVRAPQELFTVDLLEAARAATEPAPAAAD